MDLRRHPSAFGRAPRFFLSSLTLACLTLAAVGAGTVQAQESDAVGVGSTGTAPVGTRSPLQTLERVEIRSRRPSDTEQRRQSTAAKTIVGREEIERMGDSNLGDVLKRLPGVTLSGAPGRGGEIRMRGLGGGYTQILVDGERPPKGFSIETLVPEQIERIEILRAPTAETGTRAVAGTINIILREPLRQSQRQLQLGLGLESDHWQPSLGWNQSESDGPLAWNISAHLNHSDTRDRTLTDTLTEVEDLATGALTPTFRQRDTVRRHLQSDRLHLGGRLQWRLAPGQTLSLQPFIVTSHYRARTEQDRERTGSDGSAATYSRAFSDGDADYHMGRLQGRWQGTLTEGTKAEVRLGTHSSIYKGQTLRREWDSSGAFLREELDRPNTRDHGWNTAGKVSNLVLGEGTSSHEWSAGWELEVNQRNDDRAITQRFADGSTSSVSTGFGDNLQAKVQRTALWIQDEWSLNPQWAFNLGLRWEGIRTQSRSSDVAADNHTSVTTPVLHLVYRPEERSKDQFRASLTRSYLPPSLNNLSARQAISSRYPVGTDGTGTNVPSSPDYVGNPDLKPELATGIDLAMEHYLPKGGVLSAGVFHRRITNLMRGVVSQESVPWAAVPRWVSTPENIGSAHTSGIELEAKFQAAELAATPLPLELRANVSVFRSRVDSVNGPDNRLVQQPDWTANFGADYRWRSLPLTTGASLNLTSAYSIAQSNTQRDHLDGKRVLDAYALWTLRPGAKLRLSANHLIPTDYQTLSRTTWTDSSTGQRTYSTTTVHQPGYTVWGVKLELQL